MSPTRNRLAASEPLPCVVIQLGRSVERSLHRALTPRGMTTNQFMALLEIARKPGISRAGLGRALGVSPQAVAGITAAMLRGGLITRTTATRGRVIAFSLTRDGAQVLNQAMNALQSVQRELLAPLAYHSMRNAEVALRQLHEAVLSNTIE